MSSFTNPPRLDFLGNYQFRLAAPFDYHVGEFPSEEVIEVPVGFVTDFASTPRFMWGIFPPHGPWAYAAIVHDYLYGEGRKPRKECDRIFLEAMKVLGVSLTTRVLMYLAVRLFGRSHFFKG